MPPRVENSPSTWTKLGGKSTGHLRLSYTMDQLLGSRSRILEALTKPVLNRSVSHRAIAPEVEADGAHGEGVPRMLDDCQPVPADTHAFQAFEPGNGSFDHPRDPDRSASIAPKHMPIVRV